MPPSSPLEPIRSWPVGNVAAGVLGPEGTVITEGDAARPFPLASVTKLLTAAAVLVAVEEGSVALDEPVERPDGATVRDLICHASGLAFGTDLVLSPPRRKRIYSNRGYELLGELVEARTGFAFASYLSEAVCEPLGMTATLLEGSAGAGATSTVDDLLRFRAGLPRLLSAGTLADMATPQHPQLGGMVPGFGSFDPNPWGLGPEIRGDKAPHWTGTRNSPRTHGHFGRAGTFMWTDPEVNLSLVVLTDREFDDWAKSAWPALSDQLVSTLPNW